MTIKLKQNYEYVRQDFWNWSVWVDAEDSELNAIESVEYTLHQTFHDPVRLITDRKSKFKLSTSGWGTFTIYAKIRKEDGEVIDLEHELELHYPDESDPTSRGEAETEGLESGKGEVSTKSDTDKKDSVIEKRIEESLNNSQFKWRTLRRVAIEAGISEEDAADKLRANQNVRFDRNSKSGETIVGLKEKVGDTPSSSSD